MDILLIFLNVFWAINMGLGAHRAFLNGMPVMGTIQIVVGSLNFAAVLFMTWRLLHRKPTNE